MSVTMSKEELFQVLFSNGLIKQENLQGDVCDTQRNDSLMCLYHAGVKGHSIDQCPHFS